MYSPSEGELHRGDAILQVQGHDSADLTHMDAHDLSKAAEQRIQLLNRRMPGAPQTPTSPLPSSDAMIPCAKILQDTEASRPTVYRPMHSHRPTPTTHRPTTLKRYCLSPLSTTPVSQPSGGFFAPSHRNQSDVEIEERHEKSKERAAMLNKVRGQLKHDVNEPVRLIYKELQARNPNLNAQNGQQAHEIRQAYHGQINDNRILELAIAINEQYVGDAINDFLFLTNDLNLANKSMSYKVPVLQGDKILDYIG